ncbi:MAG: Dabb family protein [Pseudobdellovibrionaceae bacterium]
MTKVQAITFLTLMTFGSFAKSTTASDSIQKTVSAIGEAEFVSPQYHPGLIRHLVLFRYNDSVTAAQKKEIARRFLALKNESTRNGMPYIVSIETGNQNSGEGVDQELEQGFIVTFKSEGDRNYYVGRDIVKQDGNFDLAHDAFKRFVGQFLHTPINPTGVLVFDFKVEENN